MYSTQNRRAFRIFSATDWNQSEQSFPFLIVTDFFQNLCQLFPQMRKNCVKSHQIEANQNKLAMRRTSRSNGL